MTGRFFAFVCVLVFALALVFFVVLTSVLGDRSGGKDREPIHQDLTTAFGSEDAKVVVVAYMPIAQECVASTVRTLRQLGGMYPEHLFIALVDMEAEGYPKNITFRGCPVSDTAGIRKLLGEAPKGEKEEKPKASADTASRSGSDVLKDAMAALDKEPAKTAEQLAAEDENRTPKSFCAVISINGDYHFSFSGDADGGKKDVIFSGPHGTLYTSEDLKRAVEDTIIRKYGALPKPRIPWVQVPDALEGRKPVPLRPPPGSPAP